MADGSGQGSRRRDRASGPEAREPHGDPRRIRQDPRLRPGQARAHGLRGLARNGTSHGVAGDRGRDDPGHRRVHVARAGQRGAGGLPVRSVLLRLDPLRDDHRRARLRALDSRADALRDHRIGAGSAGHGGSQDARPARLDRRAVSLEGSRGAIRLDHGPGARSGGAARPRLGHLDFRRRAAGRAPASPVAPRACRRGDRGRGHTGCTSSWLAGASDINRRPSSS